MNKIIKTFLSLFILIVLSAIAVQAFALDSSCSSDDNISALSLLYWFLGVLIVIEIIELLTRR